MKKLPYIPDKKLYAAVMFACKMVRETGYFNQSCIKAAKYYGVNLEEVKKYVRIAQGNGQKTANKRNPKKYHWYLILYVIDYIADDDCGTQKTWGYSVKDILDNTNYRIIKATKRENAIKRVIGKVPDYGCFYFNNVYEVLEFDSEKEAEKYLSSVDPITLKKAIKEHFRK